jgi:hypothetical protein
VVEGPPNRDVETEGTYQPNRFLLVSGALLLGVPYVTSVIVAGESKHQGDSHLYIPIVGPWVDLGDRGGCNSATQNCDAEASNKVGLVIDGLLQGIGSLQLIGAFVFPEKRVTTRSTPATTVSTSPKVHVTPSKIGKTGYGLSAIGEF